MRKLKSIYYNFKIGITNLLLWFPLIWRFRNWDYTYNVEVFKFSLQQTEKQLQKDNYENAILNAEKINTIIKLMDKVYDGDYSKIDYSEIENKYGKGITNFEFTPIENSTNLSITYNYDSHPQKEEIIKLMEVLRTKANAKNEKAHQILWKLVEHNIRNFWD